MLNGIGSFEETNSPIKNVSLSHNFYYSNEAFNPVKGEMALWAAVITQALMDAGSNSPKPEAQHEKARAIRWLMSQSEDFAVVCDNAGLDPAYVREKAVQAMERSCVWRNGAAEKHMEPGKPPLQLLERKHRSSRFQTLTPCAHFPLRRGRLGYTAALAPEPCRALSK